MKKIIHIISIILLVGLLSGCQKSSEATNSQKIIGFSQSGIESSWRKANTRSIQEELTKDGYEVFYKNSYSNHAQQLQDVLEFIIYKVDMIVIAPVQEDGWDNVLKKAKEADIPVIVVDRNIETKEPNMYLTSIGPRFKSQGNRAGLYLTNHFAKTPLTEINVMELRGSENTSPTTGRHEGFIETTARDSRIRITDSLQGGYIRRKAQEEVENAATAGRFEAIDVLYSHSDEMTLGAYEVIQQRPEAFKKNLVIISVDASKEVVDLLKKGKVNCVVECNPFMGWYVANTVDRYFSDRSINEEIMIHELVFSDQGDLATIPQRNY